MIEARSLTKSYGAICAADGVSFNVDAGEIVGFLGPNGAGKSTTMKMLAGVLQPDSGSAHLCGKDVVTERIEAQHYLGYMPEAAAGFPDLTVYEFLTYCAGARGLARAEAHDAIEAVGERTLLSSAFNKPMRTLSKGWRQRAWFAQAVLHGPRVLILDEPTDGLDPGQKEHVRSYVREISSNTAIILSTHVLQEAEELCDRIVLICNGHVVKDAPINDLLDKNGRLAPAFAELTTSANAA